ncbi:copper amine oxidase N-terminal domain-containing protein [Desulforamulus ruminis]|uniref:Copper amine oxidase-like domain-containing protein n=1 Tax=Desulforamulus ruminis (strain ATCC 23193 / DSM 2154 / NCIMB 8452 / DL) TaxID=696281 RepID=F6DQK5_DESRL|nr:copper amine oxidase N-terminal domain-containing protein [Desulforamulus ruminis]AEG60899.1 copper amine oxidase-like domain-containing protein [Desulforamulus ruminis DSM 2154]
MLSAFRLCTFLAVLVLGMGICSFPALASDEVVFPIGQKVYYADGQAKIMDTPGFVKDGLIYLPTASLGEALGAEVKWSDQLEYQSIALTKGKDTVVYLLNHENFLVQHRDYYSDLARMEAVPVLINGQSYLPLRYTAENLGYEVSFDEANGAVRLTARDFFTREGYTIPLAASITAIRFYPADIEMELLVDLQKPAPAQPLEEARNILASKFGETAAEEVIQYLKANLSHGDSIPMKGFMRGKISAGSFQGDSLAVIRVWRNSGS